MATNADIDVRSYSGEIHAIVSRSGLAADVEFVGDIQEWCVRHGVPEDSPWCSGKIVRNSETGRYVILLVERITRSMVSSVISGMEGRGFASEVAQLSEPLAFVRHLVLHEIAHGLDSSRTEAACDQWAFQQLRQLPSNPTVESDARKSGARPSL